MKEESLANGCAQGCVAIVLYAVALWFMVNIGVTLVVDGVHHTVKLWLG